MTDSETQPTADRLDRVRQQLRKATEYQDTQAPDGAEMDKWQEQTGHVVEAVRLLAEEVESLRERVPRAQ